MIFTNPSDPQFQAIFMGLVIVLLNAGLTWLSVCMLAGHLRSLFSDTPVRREVHDSTNGQNVWRLEPLGPYLVRNIKHFVWHGVMSALWFGCMCWVAARLILIFMKGTV